MATTPWTIGVARLISIGGVGNASGKNEVRDIYGLIMNPGDRPAAGANGIPAYGDAHPDVDGLAVSNVSFAQPDETSNVWRATVTYSPGSTNTHEDEDEQEVVDRYTRLHIGSVTENRDLTVDAENGTPVVNSAGDPFESVPQVERDFVEIQLARNQNTHPADIIAALNGTVNSSDITVCGVSIPAKCGRIKIEADRQFGNPFPWSVTFRIVINPDTWAVTVLQNGYRYYPGGSGVSDPVKFTSTTEDGRVVECSTPQLLDENGYDNRGGTPVYATFNQYKAASWASLHLPVSLQ